MRRPSSSKLGVSAAWTLDTICANVKWYLFNWSWLGLWSSFEEDLPSNLMLSKSSFGTRVQRFFHLLDKMLMTIVSLVVRKEKIWQKRESVRLLILSSTTVGLWRFKVDFTIQSFCYWAQARKWWGLDFPIKRNFAIPCQTKLVAKWGTAQWTMDRENYL